MVAGGGLLWDPFSESHADVLCPLSLYRVTSSGIPTVCTELRAALFHFTPTLKFEQYTAVVFGRYTHGTEWVR